MSFSINSFPILEDQLSEEQIEVAENFFLSCIKQRGIEINEEDAYNYIEDGYYDDDNGYKVSLVWSNVNL